MPDRVTFSYHQLPISFAAAFHFPLPAEAEAEATATAAAAAAHSHRTTHKQTTTSSVLPKVTEAHLNESRQKEWKKKNFKMDDNIKVEVELE